MYLNNGKNRKMEKYFLLQYIEKLHNNNAVKNVIIVIILLSFDYIVGRQSGIFEICSFLQPGL